MKALLLSIFFALCFSLCSHGYAGESVKRVLHEKISQQLHDVCSEPVWCANLVSIDCRSALDGPLYYFNNEDGALLMRCGGDCLIPQEVKMASTDPFQCKTCPPIEWQNCIE